MSRSPLRASGPRGVDDEARSNDETWQRGGTLSEGFKTGPKAQTFCTGSPHRLHADAASTGARDVRYDGTARAATVHALVPGGGEASVAGPAVVEKADTTVLVPAGWTATSDDGGNLHLVRDRSERKG